MTYRPRTVLDEIGARDFKPSGMTGAVAASRYVGATTSGAPVSGTFAVGDFVIDQTGKAWVCTVAGTPGTWAQLAGGGSSTLAADTDVSIASPVGGQVLGYSDALSKWVNQNVAGVAATTSTAQLGANVTMTSANTFYDGPSVSLPPGTWLIVGTLQMGASASQSFTGKLWDGTNVYDSATTSSGLGYVSVSLCAVVTPTSTTTYKLSGAASTTGQTIYAVAPSNGTGNNASSIFAIQLSGNPVGQQAPAVRCYNSANISIPTGAWTTLTFDTNRYDQGTSTSQHSTSTNTSRLTCQQAGIYDIGANIYVSITTPNIVGVRILLNGSTVITDQLTRPNTATADTLVQVNGHYQLAVGDYVETQVIHTAGTSQNLLALANTSPEFWMARIDSGPGAVQPNTKVQLDYTATTDLLSAVTLTANTWRDICADQTFTVDDSNSAVELSTLGIIWGQGVSGIGYSVSVRYVIDSAGTPIYKDAGGWIGTNENLGNALAGISPVPVTGLTAGSHTVKMQLRTDQSVLQVYCRPATTAYEYFHLRVLERKQSSSPPSSAPAPAVRCYNSANISIPNATWTTVTYDTNRFDQGTSIPQHSVSSNTSRFTCQQAGVYQITGNIAVDTNATGARGALILLNGTTVIGEKFTQATPGGYWTTDITTVWQLAVGDYVELQVYQASGGALNVNANADYGIEFGMVRCDIGGTGAVYVPVVKTANYTILSTDNMVVSGANGLTLTLPAASAYTGKPPLVIKNDNFTATTIARAGSDTIDGATSYALVAAYSSVSLVSDSNATWRAI